MAEKNTNHIYQILVRGKLDQHWAAWFDGFTLIHVKGDTLLTGSVEDQAALYGVVTKIRDLGLHLVSIQPISQDDNYTIDSQTFVTIAIPGKTVPYVLMLAASLRDFGGTLADTSLWVFVPENLGILATQESEKLAAFNATIVPCVIDEEILKFPFGLKVQVAALAEQKLAGKTELLTWLDSDTLILSDPHELSLVKGKILGYRPVHHRLIGPAWDEPLDPFWLELYQICGISTESSFSMHTYTGEKIRPYFNAGAFTLRPQKGLLSRWWQIFQQLYQAPAFTAFYEQDSRYAIFMHQAVFTGVLLQTLKREEFQELSPQINYPLHLHHEVPTRLRPKTINELITVRHEDIFQHPDWQKKLPINEPLLSWLKAQIGDRP